MQLEVGSIFEGKITGITKFGAFVELPSGKTGMVHISEVAATYVKEISDHLVEDQLVKVKVLSISPEGKVSLSIKKCQPAPSPEQQSAHQSAQPSSAPQQRRPPSQRPPPRKDTGWKGFRTQPGSENMSFEDMLVKFKQTSDDKMSDLKKTIDLRKGSGRRSGGNSK